MGTSIAVHQYMKYQTNSLESAVVKRVEMGTCPPSEDNMIPRRTVTDEIVNLFFPKTNHEFQDYDQRTFGLIVGPTGTGKTALVTKLCSMLPEGVLFFEVREPKAFATGLAKSLSMKIAPSNIFDLFLGYFSSDYFMYYRLSEDQEVALDSIFEVLERAASKFKSAYGKMPTLFVDSADMLAKHEKGLFIHLVAHAKRMANAGILRVVFVSSEGSILPIVQKLSGISRCSKIFEITDVSDEAAVNYLTKNGLSRELSNKLIEFVGGRFVYLISIINLHKMYKKVYPELNDEILFRNIKEDIFSRKLASQRWVINTIGKPSTDILHVVSKEGEAVPSELIAIGDSPERTIDINDAISTLVDINVLRYTNRGSLTWHGRPQRHEFEE